MEGYFALDVMLGESEKGRAQIRAASKSVADALEVIYADEQLPDADCAALAQSVFSAGLMTSEPGRNEQDTELVLACLEAVDREMPLTGIVVLAHHVIEVDPIRSHKSQAAFLMFSCVNDAQVLTVPQCQMVVDFIVRQAEQTAILSGTGYIARIDKYMAAPLIEIATHCEARLHENTKLGHDTSSPMRQLTECMATLARSSKGLMQLYESKSRYLHSQGASPEHHESFILQTLNPLLRVSVQIAPGDWQFRSGLKNMLTDLVAFSESAEKDDGVDPAIDSQLVRKLIISSLLLEPWQLSQEMKVLPFGATPDVPSKDFDETHALVERLHAALGPSNDDDTRKAYTNLLAALANTVGAHPGFRSVECTERLVGPLYERADAGSLPQSLDDTGRRYLVGYVMRKDPERGSLYGLSEKGQYISEAFGI